MNVAQELARLRASRARSLARIREVGEGSISVCWAGARLAFAIASATKPEVLRALAPLQGRVAHYDLSIPTPNERFAAVRALLDGSDPSDPR